jgi:hypothetical protein
MSLSDKTLVQISAPEGSGKTNLAVAFAKFCAQHGVTVTLPPDPQRDEKMALPIEDLMAKIAEKGIEIVILENNAVPHRHEAA